ncbi:MAG: DUF4384 domain-containing protein [Deltaproteobacteria bacterium]|nr:DUF4384 domain-containing protein [Deltaproteobacteria bacterium]
MIVRKGVWSLALLICFISSSTEAPAQSCAPPSDWRNISLLPTNGDAGANIKITLQADKTDLAPGDKILLTFQADRECYLSIMNVGTSGKIVRLWPNSYSGADNRISAHTPRQFPAPEDGFVYRIGGPPGVERIVAYATSEKGKILDEAEFQQMGQSGFKQFRGSSKDLAVVFQDRTERLSGNVRWGSAQINLCVGAGASPAGNPAPAPAPVRENPDPGEGPKSLYCVAVGVSLGKLKYCEDDTRKFVDLFQAKMGLKQENTRLLLAREANHSGFTDALRWLAAATKPQDSVIIYFNGHGASLPDQPPLDEADGRDEAFVLYHVEGPRLSWREALKRKHLMLDDDFNRMVKKIPARGKILIADSCHSGTISKEAVESDELVSKFYPLLDPDTGQEMPSLKTKAVPVNYGNDNEACMAACLDNQSSYESPRLKSSVFTHYLLEAIKSGAPDLRTAFESAKAGTLKYCAEASRKGRQRALTQTPNLTDPHGMTQLLGFSR